MEAAVWPPAHCEALKEFVTKGMSYGDATRAINARFGTEYSRSAVLGRARRMRTGEPDRPRQRPEPGLGVAEALFQRAAAERMDDLALLRLLRHRPVFPRAEVPQIRCVEVAPRHLDLMELEVRECGYPYGGDEEGEPITFCGHPRRDGSRYCTPHFFLTRNPDVPISRTVSTAPLRLIAATGKFWVKEIRNGTTEAPQGIRSLERI